MSVPEKSLYKDVNGDSKIPHIKEDTVHTYLRHFDASLNDKVKGFYKDQFLSYVRHTPNNNLTFVHAKCYAEMKKGLSYFVDVSLDNNGIIQESQCDCSAGEGPDAHCKHVQTVLWALTQWSKTKKIITEETCTQVLQTFHKAKKLTGSPIKTMDLALGSEETFDFEPRSAKYIDNKGYGDYVRNLIINFPHSDPIPIEGIIEPANPYAISTDHTYPINNPEDQYLKDNMISTITSSQIVEIEQKTLQQKDNKEWASERCKRITSSNFGRVCLATDQTDFSKLAYSLTTSSNPKSKYLKHGHQYEPVAVDKFEEDEKVKTKKCGLFVSKSHPFLGASPDRLLGDDTLVEVKCPWTAKDQEITPVTVPWLQLNNCELELDKKHSYYYQIQGQLFCTGRVRCILVVYTFIERKYIEITRDESFISEMIETLTGFYNKYFKQAVARRFLHRDYYGYSFQPSNVY